MVPIPTRVFTPPFTYIALGKRVDVEVANLSDPAPPPEPQATPVEFTTPLIELRQPSDSVLIIKPCVSTINPAKVDVAVVFRREADRPFVIEVVALPVTVRDAVEKLVVVALVPVALMKVKFWRVVLPVARMLAAVNREFMKPFVAVNEVVNILVDVD